MRYQFATGPEFSKIHQDTEMSFLGLHDLPLIVGLTGPLKSGKTMAAQYMVAERAFEYVSLSSFLRTRAGQLGARSWEQVRLEGLRWRKESGNAALVEEFLHRSSLSSKRIVVDSLIYPAEIDRLKQLSNFYLLAVEADLDMRWTMFETWWGAPKGGKTPVSRAEFEARDAWEHGQAPLPGWEHQSPSVGKCVKRAHYRLKNEGSERQLQQGIDEKLKEIITSKGLTYSCQWCEW